MTTNRTPEWLKSPPLVPLLRCLIDIDPIVAVLPQEIFQIFELLSATPFGALSDDPFSTFLDPSLEHNTPTGHETTIIGITAADPIHSFLLFLIQQLHLHTTCSRQEIACQQEKLELTNLLFARHGPSDQRFTSILGAVHYYSSRRLAWPSWGSQRHLPLWVFP